MNFNTFYKQETYFLILEGLPIQRFKKEIPSQRNIEFYKKRQKEGNTGSFLTKVNWIGDKLDLFFRVIPTPTKPILNVAKSGQPKKGKEYKLQVQFEKVSDILGKKKDFLNKSKKEQIELVRKLTKQGVVNLHSNDPSYTYQGGWKRLSDAGASVNPFPNLPDKGIWADRHGKDLYITKHFLEVFSVIPFIVDEIAKKIRE